MLEEIGIVWENYPEYFKTGTLAVKGIKKFDKIPEEYAQYHQDKEQNFFRTEIKNFNMPELLKDYSTSSKKLLEMIDDYKDTSVKLKKFRK